MIGTNILELCCDVFLRRMQRGLDEEPQCRSVPGSLAWNVAIFGSLTTQLRLSDADWPCARVRLRREPWRECTVSRLMSFQTVARCL